MSKLTILGAYLTSSFTSKPTDTNLTDSFFGSDENDSLLHSMPETHIASSKNCCSWWTKCSSPVWTKEQSYVQKYLCKPHISLWSAR